MIEDFLFPPKASGTLAPDADVVLSSRARLSRNLSGHAFSWRAGGSERRIIRETLAQAWLSFDGRDSTELRSLSADERRALAEREAIGQTYALDADAWLGWGSERPVWLTANEGDHARFRGEMPGLAVLTLTEALFAVELGLRERLAWAFDARMGFLCPDPADCGSGLVLSAILHLPALSMTMQIEPCFRGILSEGLEIGGFWSEEGASSASVYELSLRCPADQAPETVARRVEAAVSGLVEEERGARASLPDKDPLGLADAVGRAFGLARYARKLRYDEAAEAVSLLRLGLERGLVSGVTLRDASALLVGLRRSHLAFAPGPASRSEGERRAEVLRSTFSTAALVQEHARV